MKLRLTILIFFFNTVCVYAHNISIDFFDTKLNQNVNMNNIPKVVLEYFEQKGKLQDISNIKIMPVYSINAPAVIDYYFLIIASNKDYSFLVNKIFIENNTVTNNIDNYMFTKQDLQQISKKYYSYEPKCPDDKIEFVVATPIYKETPFISVAIDDVYELVQKTHLRVVKLIDDEATVGKYLDYFTCKNLKGFFSIGHGSSDSIELADGILNADLVATNLKDTLSGTVVLFNSCSVFGNDFEKNTSLKDAFINKAKVQKFIGGYNMLRKNSSELVSACFWHKGFNKAPLDDAKEICVEAYSPLDIFGIAGNGINYFKLSLADESKI